MMPKNRAELLDLIVVLLIFIPVVPDSIFLLLKWSRTVLLDVRSSPRIARLLPMVFTAFSMRFFLAECSYFLYIQQYRQQIGTSEHSWVSFWLFLLYIG